MNSMQNEDAKNMSQQGKTVAPPEAQKVEPEMTFTFKFTLTEVNQLLTALSEAPLKFSKDSDALILSQAIPQEKEHLAAKQKPLLHTV